MLSYGTVVDEEAFSVRETVLEVKVSKVVLNSEAIKLVKNKQKVGPHIAAVLAEIIFSCHVLA